MEPRIQYAKTADGVSIAFYAMGEGPPLDVYLDRYHLDPKTDTNLHPGMKLRFSVGFNLLGPVALAVAQPAANS